MRGGTVTSLTVLPIIGIKPSFIEFQRSIEQKITASCELPGKPQLPHKNLQWESTSSISTMENRGKKIFIFIPSQGLYLFELLLKLTKPLHILFNLFSSNGTRVLY